MATTQIYRFADLEAFLTETQVPHRSDAALQVIEVPVKTPPLSGLLYIRWDRKLPYVQIIHPFVANVPEDRIREIETAICRVNTTVALPGIGYEYEKHFVYMRLCVPIYEEGMLARSFQRQLFGVVQNAKDFCEAFRDVVTGTPGAEVLARAVAHRVEHETGSGHESPQN